MEIFQSRYFRNGWRLAHLTGNWPWQCRKYVYRGLFVTTVTLFNIPTIISMMNTGNRIIMMDNLVTMLSSIACIIKVLALMFAEKKVKRLYEGIANNWETITEPNERKILIKHSEFARKLSVGCSTTYVITYLAFVMPAWIPIVLNFIMPLPEPRPYIYLMDAEYGLENQDEYYYYIYLSDLAKMTGLFFGVLSVDPLYLLCVEHFVALYAVITYRLQSLKRRKADNFLRQKAKDESYDWLVETIKAHQKTVSLTSTLESCSSVTLLWLVLINLIAIPVVCVLVYASLRDGHLINFLRYGSYFVGIELHFFSCFWPGQRLKNCSSRLFEDMYTNEWYETSEETKKLLKIMMIRCTQPSTLTAGGFITMNMENYYVIMKLTVSYITVLASFQ